MPWSSRPRRLFACALAASIAGAFAGAHAGEGPASERPAAAGDLSKPRDAGIRYGQAAGVAAVCPELRVTARAEALAGAFSGADLATFNTQAEAVLASWKKTMTCAHTADPNPCRLANQMSCREAMKEIGPDGLVAPGLIEMAKTQ